MFKFMQTNKLYKLYIFQLGIIAAGWTTLIIFTFIYGITEPLPLLKISIYIGMIIATQVLATPVADGYLSLETGVILASIYIFGLVYSAWITVISVLITGLIFRRRSLGNPKTWLMIWFNSGQYIISLAGCILIYYFLKLKLPFSGKLFLPEIAGIIMFFVINNLLITVYLFLNFGKNSIEQRLSVIKLDILTYIIGVPAGILMVLFNRTMGFYSISLVFALFIMAAYLFRLYLRIEKSNRELTALHHVAVTINSKLELSEVLDIILNTTENIIGWDFGAILLVDDDGCLTQVKKKSLIPIPETCEIKLKNGTGITGSVMKSRKSKIVNNPENDPRNLEIKGFPDGLKSILITPLLVNEEVVGEIFLGSLRLNHFNDHHLWLLDILSSQAAVAICNANKYLETKKMAMTDGLTGVYNYRYIFTKLKKEIDKAVEEKTELSLILLDIDHFKIFNDKYGHQAGDKVLMETGKILIRNVREGDTIGRYGGEEFAVILPEASGQEAYSIAERIRSAIENYDFYLDDKKTSMKITISAGISTFPHDAKNVAELVKMADKAMLQGAKQKGRNKVVKFTPRIN